MSSVNDAMNNSMSSDAAGSFLSMAVELAGGDQVVAQRLLEMIVETNRTTLMLLSESVTAGSWDSAASSAHRLSGSARMLELDDLVVLIDELEAAARAHKHVLTNTLLPHVVSAVTEFEASIKAALSSAGQP
jgi:HPt (histidine-containing phosphotransfer) domain-containing protein